MDDTDLRYPLRPRPAEPYYTLELHLCSDYVYHMSELIDPFPNKVWCACGQLLEYYAEGERSNIFSSSRIHCVCPNCRSDFDPARQCARVRHGWTGETIGFIPGGAAYRFAVVVDCGKCIPDREMGRIDFEPDLVSVCKKRLGCDFYQLTDLY
jgi:hypothetical protein